MSVRNNDNKVSNHFAMGELTLPAAVVAFQDLLCDACLYSNDGECVKDDAECPVATVKRSYRKGG